MNESDPYLLGYRQAEQERLELCALLLQACSPALSQTAKPEPTPTTTVQPTPGPTATVWSPTFVSWSLREIRKLDRFVVTINEKNTVNGELTELTNSIEYIQQSYSTYNQNKYASGVDRTYAVDNWTYSLTGSGDWYISAGR